MDHEGLADLFYEAALVPELWPAALSAFARRFDGSCAVLIAKGRDGVRWTTSTGDDHIMRDYVDGGWEARTDKIERSLKLNLKRFISDRDVYTPEELRRDPAFEGFYLPRGLGAEFGSVFAMPTGDTAVASVQRRFGAPPQDGRALAAADALRPHLARAAVIAARLGLDRARSAVDALVSLGLPAAALTARGRVLVGNDRLQALMPGVLREIGGRLTLADRTADAAMGRALEELRARSSLTTGSIAIRARPEGKPWVAHLIPIKGGGRDIFVGAACLLIVTEAAPMAPPDEGLLASLFGLTPAEARVAKAAVILGSAPAVAEDLRVSRETVKSHLRAVLAKTGAESQQGLTALIASLSTVPVQR